MKKIYQKPKIKLISCHSARMLAAASGPADATIGGKNVDSETNPSPGAREFINEEYNGLRWDD